MLLGNDKEVHTELVESPTLSSSCVQDMNLFRLVQKACYEIIRKQLAHICPLVVELHETPTAVRTMASHYYITCLWSCSFVPATIGPGTNERFSPGSNS